MSVESKDESKDEKEEELSPALMDKIDENGCYKEGSIREIGVFYEVFRVSNIDTAQQTFKAQFELQFTWLPSKEDIENHQKDPTNYKPSFIPKYNWTNGELVEMKMDNIGYELLKHGGKDTWGNILELPVPAVNAVLYDVKGTYFVPNMNLKNFPFDCLDLSIQLECQQSIDTVILIPSFDIGNEVVDVTDNCSKLNPAFKLHKPLCEIIAGEFDDEHYSTFILHLKFERYWATYSNVYITLFLLCLCTLCIFAFDYNEHLNDRVSNIFTMLLTVVAYEFVLQSDLPKIPYYTKADIYILSCFIYIIFIAVEVIIIFFISEVDGNEKDAEKLDNIAFWVTLIGFLLWNLIYIVIVIRAKKEELEKVKWYEADYEDDEDDEDEDEEEEEEGTTVNHTQCVFAEKVEKRLGLYWTEHLKEKENKKDDDDDGDDDENDDNKENDDNDGQTQTVELNKTEIEK